MGEYDFRSLTDDDDFSFDEEFDLDSLGQELDDEGNVVVEEPGPLNQFLGSMSAAQRMILMLMLFANVLVLGLGLLLATGRIG